MSFKCLRTDLDGHVLSVAFTRGEEYNTIIPELRHELNEVRSAVGWRQAVRERDDAFGDYGSRSR